MIKTKKNIDILNGSIIKGMLAFSIPLMISSILQLLFNAADIIVLQKFAGEIYMSAVGSVSSFSSLIVTVFIGLSIGINVIIAKDIGENNKSKISNYIHSSILFGVIIGAILIIVGYLLSDYAIINMKLPQEIQGYAKDYLIIFFFTIPGQLIYNFGAAILRAKGDTKRPLYYLAFAGVLNVVLNIIFVVYFNANVKGVALATLISQYVSMILILKALNKEENEFEFNFSKLKIDITALYMILKTGLPAGIQNCLFSLANVVIQTSINSLGSYTIAAHSAASNIEGFLNAIVTAFMQTVMTYVSCNYGAKNYKRIKKSIKCSIYLNFVTMLVVSIVIFFFSNEILSLYLKTPEVIEIAKVKLTTTTYLYIVFALLQTCVGTIRGLGYSLTPTIVSLIGICGLRLIWIYTAFNANPTYKTCLLSYPISWTITMIVLFLIMIRILRKKKKDLQYL